MTVPPATADRDPRGWWRRNAGWLLGACVLGAWAFAAPYRDARQSYEARHPAHAIEVARGASATYAGARWRVLSSRRIDRPRPADALQWREDAVVWVVRFEVVPGAGVRGDALDACRGAISDAQGRRWEANPLALSRWRGAVGTLCGTRLGPDFKRIEAQPGAPFVFEQTYLLPRAPPPRGLRAELQLPSSLGAAEGSFLRFAL